MTRQLHLVGLLVLAIATLGPPPRAIGQELVLGRSITERPKTYMDLKFAYTVRQRRDFTCGAAALATILKYHYGMPVTEEMIFWMIANRYKLEELKNKAENGFSFEDLIYVAGKLGFESQAAVVGIAELQKLNGPVILQLKLKRFEHFAVLRKKTDELAYMSDPVTGQTTLNNAEFKTEFKGPVLAIWPSYVTDDYFSALSVIRDPISASRTLRPITVQPFVFPAPK
jgi:uncharacterized protein